MWFKSREEKHRPETDHKFWSEDATLDRGVYYLYLIIGLQVLFVLGLMGIIMFIGKVISTPAWVFLFIFGVSIAGITYIYQKAKRRLRQLRETFGRTDRNYEISLMGGMLTMRIEQNMNSANLLAAPVPPVDDQVIDAETNQPDAAPKSVQPH